MKTKPDINEVRELIKTYSVRELAIKYGYHGPDSFRVFMKANGIINPRVSGMKVIGKKPTDIKKDKCFNCKWVGEEIIGSEAKKTCLAAKCRRE